MKISVLMENTALNPEFAYVGLHVGGELLIVAAATAVTAAGLIASRVTIASERDQARSRQIAAESRAFNRNTSEPVTYATLTIINLGNPQPVTLARTRVTLLLESGEEVPSMDVKPLLRLSALDDQMRQRLTEHRMIAPGMMAADIPICLSSQFRWERARAVKVSFQTGDLLIAGRVLTADEKRNLTEQAAKPQNTVTNLSAEDWFKEM